MPASRPPDLPAAGLAGRGLACRRGEQPVFEGLDFHLPPGGALILRGANGSGKSSLLRLMAGLTPPAAGTLAWDGVSVGEDPGAHRARLHFVGHADALKPALTVTETLEFWAGMRGGGDVAAGLERFRLRPMADLPCRFLSAGQKRRLALARLAVSAARLWLLDEPLTGLDEDAVADLHQAISAHRAGGGSVALSTHAPLALAAAATLALGDYAPSFALAALEP